MQLAEAFNNETTRQQTFAGIALSLIEAEQYEQSLQRLERLSDRWLTAGMLTQIADRHLNDGKTAKAANLLN